MENTTSNCDRAPCQNNFPIQNRPILLRKKKKGNITNESV